MLMRTVIVLVFGAISFTCAAFVLDASGAQTTPYKYFRRHGLGNILTVLLCVVINGFAYWVSTLIRAQQSTNKTLAGQCLIDFDLIDLRLSFSVCSFDTLFLYECERRKVAERNFQQSASLDITRNPR